MGTPTDSLSFFSWFREQTEGAWTRRAPRPFEYYRVSGVGGDHWQSDTRWSPLSNAEISMAEEKWGLRFPDDYRTFLRELGATDRPMHGARFRDSALVPTTRPGFYDWRTDDAAIENALRWPFEGLKFDVERNALWLESWGRRPRTESARKRVLRDLVQAAPPLIPVHAHRYLVGEPSAAGNVVLSVYQADIIVYGVNLRAYLMNELGVSLGLDMSGAPGPEAEELTRQDIGSIPFWGEIMLAES